MDVWFYTKTLILSFKVDNPSLPSIQSISMIQNL